MKPGERFLARNVAEPRTFLSVAETARLLGMSEMTLYRAINAGEFPAVRIRGRLIIPARAIEEMVEATLTTGRPVDTADWVRPGMREADQGSVPVVPLIGFALFLLTAAALFSGSVMALVAVGLGIVVAVAGVVAVTLRQEGRVNAAGTAWLELPRAPADRANDRGRDEVRS
jgi:excisionase family DNA binding protein